MGTTAEVLKKVKGWDFPRLLALLEAFPEENLGAEAVLRGEKRIILEDIIRLLADQTGRGIPAHLGLTFKACDENRKFYVNQPQWTYREAHALFVDSFPKGTKFLSLAEFEDRGEAALQKIKADPLTCNFTNRAHMPLLSPQHVVTDEGTSLQEFYLPVVSQVYKTQFPDREFNNYLDGELAGQVTTIPETGHDYFIATSADGPGMFWYFPNPMQGFSVLAQQQSMKLLLPRGFSLAGAIETALGLIGYSKEMAWDYNTPGYDCSAVSFRSSSSSLLFLAFVAYLKFDAYDFLDYAFGLYSGGLVFVG